MPSTLLALDSALGACAAGLYRDEACIAGATETMERGHAARLPALTQAMLSEAGNPAIDLIAVTVGPGSFTGIRAALALAHGLGAGWGVPVIGVSVDEVLAIEAASCAPQAPIWVVLIARPGHIFLAQDGVIRSLAVSDLPAPPPGLIVAGPAAHMVAEVLSQYGLRPLVCPVAAPDLAIMAAVARDRQAGRLPPRAAQPIYVDPPAARPIAPERPAE